jgi:hypothetical protein
MGAAPGRLSAPQVGCWKLDANPLARLAGAAALLAAAPALAGNTNPAQDSYGGLSRKTGKAVRSSLLVACHYSLTGASPGQLLVRLDGWLHAGGD